MTTKFIDKESAKAEACRLAGLKENVLKDIKPISKKKFTCGILSEKLEADVYEFKNTNDVSVNIGISPILDEDGYHLWLFGDVGGVRI